jgi:hypothetical protein
LQTTTSLTNPNWTTLNFPGSMNTNGSGVITVTNNGNSAFYRLSVQMAP